MSEFGMAIAEVFKGHLGRFGESVSYTFADGTTLSLTAVPQDASAVNAQGAIREITRGRVALQFALADLLGHTPSAAGHDRVVYLGDTYVVVDAPPTVDGATVTIEGERDTASPLRGKTHR